MTATILSDLKQLGKKLLLIMADVGYVQKTGHNQAQNYRYAKEADIASKLREAMIKHGVAFFTSVESHNIREYDKGSGKMSYLAEVTLKVCLLDTDSGEAYTGTFVGTGTDSGDKAVYKATTGAEKYALLKLFLLETGDDPENDEKTEGEGDKAKPSGDRQPPPQRPQQGQPTGQRPQQQSGSRPQGQPSGQQPQRPAQQSQQRPQQTGSQQPTEQKKDPSAPAGGSPADKPADTGNSGASSPASQMADIEKVLVDMGLARIESEEGLKGNTYFVKGNKILSRSIKKTPLQGAGFSWDGAEKAMARTF